MTKGQKKVALVTGAARGIGLAAAKRFLAEGWHVVLLDIEKDLLAQTFKTLNAPDTTLAIHCDVSDAVAVDAAFTQSIAHFGRLDALVNNAGIAIFKPLLETIPMKGTFRLHFEVAPYFSALGVETFFPSVFIDFVVKDVNEHFHVPLLLNPFGYSTYRGS